MEAASDIVVEFAVEGFPESKILQRLCLRGRTMPKNIDHKKIRRAARDFHRFLIREGEVKPRVVASPPTASSIKTQTSASTGQKKPNLCLVDKTTEKTVK